MGAITPNPTTLWKHPPRRPVPKNPPKNQARRKSPPTRNGTGTAAVMGDPPEMLRLPVAVAASITRNTRKKNDRRDIPEHLCHSKNPPRPPHNHHHPCPKKNNDATNDAKSKSDCCTLPRNNMNNDNTNSNITNRPCPPPIVPDPVCRPCFLPAEAVVTKRVYPRNPPPPVTKNNQQQHHPRPWMNHDTNIAFDWWTSIMMPMMPSSWPQHRALRRPTFKPKNPPWDQRCLPRFPFHLDDTRITITIVEIPLLRNDGDDVRHRPNWPVGKLPVLKTCCRPKKKKKKKRKTRRTIIRKRACPSMTLSWAPMKDLQKLPVLKTCCRPKKKKKRKTRRTIIRKRACPSMILSWAPMRDLHLRRLSPYPKNQKKQKRRRPNHS